MSAGPDVLFCLAEENLYAYGARCPACEADLGDRRRSTGRMLACPGCGQAYDIVQAGRAAGRSDLHLEPFPHPHPRRTHPGGPAAAAGGGRIGVTMGPQDAPRRRRSAAFEVLRRFAKARAPVERCDLCGLEIGAEHDHLIDPAERRLACACGACAVLFSAQAGTRYKRVPAAT